LGLLIFSTVPLGILFVSCQGSDYGVLQPSPENLCNCLPIGPHIADYRHVAKHVAIPNIAPVEIDVDTILAWPEDLIPLPPNQPRTGRELQVFHLSQAFLQEASVNAADCDIHFEISQAADKAVPRVIVETPSDSEYCGARQKVQSQLAKHSFRALHFTMMRKHSRSSEATKPDWPRTLLTTQSLAQQRRI